jgi:hypothetical protein
MAFCTTEQQVLLANMLFNSEIFVQVGRNFRHFIATNTPSRNYVLKKLVLSYRVLEMKLDLSEE